MEVNELEFTQNNNKNIKRKDNLICLISSIVSLISYFIFLFYYRGTVPNFG